jgi:murein DD-endopeptidase MepM/ murein hydrolase activator NlpD
MAVLLVAVLMSVPLGGANATVTPAGPSGLAAPGLAAVGSGPAAAGPAPWTRAAGRQSAGPWVWPLEPEPAVVRRFQPAPTPWGAGHRGVDLAAVAGQPVLAAAAGVVSYVGVIAGRGVLAVRHAGGLRTTYEPVTASVSVGAKVSAGHQIAVVSQVPGHCWPATCLHWGLIRGSTYLDPLLVFGLSRPVLLPVIRQ